jgi:hypothetical protein
MRRTTLMLLSTFCFCLIVLGADDHPRPFRTFSRKDRGTPTDATIAAAIPATAALAP